MQKPRRIRSGWPFGALVAAAVVLAAAAAWFLAGRLEGEQPSVALDAPAPLFIGAAAEIPFGLADAKSGLRRFTAVLILGGKETLLADTEFPASGLLGLTGVRQESVRVKVAPRELNLADGKGVLNVAVRDRSWRNWGRGNLTELRREVVVDTRPPAIEVMTQQNYINQGGAGVAVYRLSEECPVSGVRVGDRFYPGFGGRYADRSAHIAFFALGHDQPPGVPIVLEATDAAGNSARTRFPHAVRKKTFKKDRLTISDGFIQQILPGLQGQIPPQAGATLKEAFLYINRDMRRLNYEAIVAATRRPQPAMLWQGPFGRLPNAAPRAGFADHRTYLYDGKEIDQQFHLGVDLASLANAPVPAANAGVVAAAAFIGIYGETVILDHGLGVFSMYSHLSQITVKPGDRLAKDEVLGYTGTSGLAGGDHLHFGMLVHATFVDPVEWWDPHWIRDNITLKLEAVKSPPAGK
ncbi:MAG: M23 family metallopeptidase [Desulfobacterales bacterium]|jgi:murein DD-endopeptidase MepM/ murein hydrolase activator NlpD|nr:M23 family metallopeptidase [Desulfobacterales bacterium]